ncbi:MAG: hypothetical protein HOF98_09095 [Gammaproteobacteria bacterium]|jgi:hypothetical protein|nr:hypothetical protein [Gammaproteobacteria bacterium]
MKMRFAWLVVGLLVPFSANAAEGKSGYVRGAFNYSSQEDVTVFGSSRGGGEVSFENGLGGELALGANLWKDKSWSVEFVFSGTSYDADSATPNSGFGSVRTAVTAAGDATIYTSGLGLLYSYKKKKVHPYIGVGVGAAFIDVNDASVGTTTEVFNVSSWAPAANVSAGVSIPVGKKGLAVDIGYKFAAIGDLSDAVGVSASGNDVKTRYTTNHNALVGLRLNF